MKNLSFENRTSLTRKSESIIKTIEELSSCYVEREKFALLNPHAQIIRTSEIFPPLPGPLWNWSDSWSELFFVLVQHYSYSTIIIGEGGGNLAVVDSTINKNIV